jgi:hypothetical protein
VDVLRTRSADLEKKQTPYASDAISAVKSP